MRSMTLHELASSEALAFDAAVLQTPAIDHFCSSTDWVVPADAYLSPGREPWLFRGPHGYVALMRGQHPEGWTYLAPLEASWCLACPLIAPQPDEFMADFAKLCIDREDEWHVMILAGLAPDSVLFRSAVAAMSRRYIVRRGPVTHRHIADLSGGESGFWGRRTRNLRRAVRKAHAKARAAGVVFEAANTRDPDQADDIFDRMLRVEAASWKGQQDVGINRSPMSDFYRVMHRRLAQRGAQRVLFARHEGVDVGYIFGALFGDTYRGLQFSFDSAFGAYSLGNLLQERQIQELCALGVQSYDLGTDVDYKRRWAERSFHTLMLFVYK